MSQIIGGHTFVPLERNIDDVKLNAITGGATITSELISTQTATTSTGSGDYFLLLQSGGTLAKILTSDLANSLGSSSGMVSAITSVRLRSFNAVGNSDFGVDQINVGTTVTSPGAGTKIVDRWIIYKAGTLSVNAGQNLAQVLLPGTSFGISRTFFRITLTTVEAALGASDGLFIYSNIEGPQLRELLSDVHSVSLLVRSSVAGLKFGLSIRDPATAYSLVSLCTIPSANTWTLITLPALPIWTGSVAWTTAPGNIGYVLSIALAAGSTIIAPSNGTWNGGNYVGASGQSNFAASVVNSTFDVAFVQHEPGSQATTLMDKPFIQSYDDCQRYYCKSYPYAVKPGTVDSTGPYMVIPASANPSAWIPFPRTLATSPAMAAYSTATGTSGNVRDVVSSLDRAVTAVAALSQVGFGGFSLSTLNSATTVYSFHYTADSGW